MVTVSKNFGDYNARRYSKPWGAIITFDGVKPKYNFSGQFLGKHIGGDGSGSVAIKCSPGDIVAFGQKDNRNPKYTENDFYIVKEDGSILAISKSDALFYWQNKEIGE